MKRNKLALVTVIAGLALVIPVSSIASNLAQAANADVAVLGVSADAPYAPIKPVPPVCTFLFRKDGRVVQPAVTAKGIANRGICRDRNGNKVWGTQFSYTKLTVTGYGGTDCPIKKDFGTTGEGGVIPVTLKGVTVAYTINVWLPKATTHLASVRSNPRSTRSFTVPVPGKSVCPGNPPVVSPEGPNSPTGSGNGGDAQTGFICGWAGTKQLTTDQYGIHIPSIDCSGNGLCEWKSNGSSYVKFGFTIYPGFVECANGVSGIPVFNVDVAYPDGTVCHRDIGGVDTYPLPPPSQWYGSVTVTAVLISTSHGRDPAAMVFPKLTLGPIHGTGTTRLC